MSNEDLQLQISELLKQSALDDELFELCLSQIMNLFELERLDSYHLGWNKGFLVSLEAVEKVFPDADLHELKDLKDKVRRQT